MNVKVYRHGIGFDTCKGASRRQNAKVKTMEITRHDGSKFSDERARCRWCKKWLGFDLIPGEAERVARHRNINNYYSANPSPDNPLVKQAAIQQAKTKALVEAPCWICHAKEMRDTPLPTARMVEVARIAADFSSNLCDPHEIELAAVLLHEDD